MFKRLSALIWLRTQIFITNKNILIPVLMPYFMVLLLKFVMNTDSSKGLDLMSLCFSMAIGMAVGSPISAMIAEEKEKNNLTTLLLNGVRPVEYVISVLFYPVLISLGKLFYHYDYDISSFNFDKLFSRNYFSNSIKGSNFFDDSHDGHFFRT